MLTSSVRDFQVLSGPARRARLAQSIVASGTNLSIPFGRPVDP